MGMPVVLQVSSQSIGSVYPSIYPSIPKVPKTTAVNVMVAVDEKYKQSFGIQTLQTKTDTKTNSSHSSSSFSPLRILPHTC